MEKAAINSSSLSIKYKELTENFPCIKDNRLLLP